MPTALLTAAAIDVAKELGISVVKRFFQPKDKKEQDLVSIGLAVGYFYNFLDPLNNVLANNVFNLYEPTDNKETSLENPKTSYSIDDVNVEVIIPKRLDVEAKAACENEFKKFDKGYFYLPQNNRFYGINYFTAKVGNTQRLTIVDFARPALAAKRYYEEILGIRPYKNDEKWFKTQISELTAFKESLMNLQQLGYGVLVNKLSFREIG
jgi:hypothetical protein